MEIAKHNAFFDMLVLSVVPAGAADDSGVPSAGLSGSTPVSTGGTVPFGGLLIPLLWVLSPSLLVSSFNSVFSSFLLFRLSVEEEINHDFPRLSSDETALASEKQNFSGEHPPHKSKRLLSLIVTGDGNINKVQGGVSVAEGNSGDVDV